MGNLSAAWDASMVGYINLKHQKTFVLNQFWVWARVLDL